MHILSIGSRVDEHERDILRAMRVVPVWEHGIVGELRIGW